MSAAQIALEKPSYQELEQKITHLTELLHVAFLSICTLQSERDRAQYGERLRSENSAVMREIQANGLMAVMQRLDRHWRQKPEPPLAAAAAARGIARRVAYGMTNPLSWNCPHEGIDRWGCGAPAGEACDWAHDPPGPHPEFHAERQQLADDVGGEPAPVDVIDRAAADLAD